MLVVHNKTGNIYAVIGPAENTTNGDNNGQVMILYYSINNPSFLFVREVNEFWDKFTKMPNIET